MEILNPIKNFTYEFIENLLKEVKTVFPNEPFIHLGMDEVYYACWESNPDIKEWMKQNNFTLTNQVEQYFMERTLSIANKVWKQINKIIIIKIYLFLKIGYKVTVWQDVHDNNVKVLI